MKLDHELLRGIVEWSDGQGYIAHQDTLTKEWRIGREFSGMYTIEEIEYLRAEMNAVRAFVANGGYANAQKERAEREAFDAKLTAAIEAIEAIYKAHGAGYGGRTVETIIDEAFPQWPAAEREAVAAQVAM